MTNRSTIAVVGLGEVGKPLFELMSESHDTLGIDLGPLDVPDSVQVLHVCYPFEIRDFIGETARYIAMFRPSLTVINSTVAIGTTREIAVRTGTSVVNSPVRGKHARMLEELRMYRKYIGPLTPEDGEMAASHFESVGLETKVLRSPEATELAKLTETTYFGVLIAWAQDVQRYCDCTGQDYKEVVSFYEEVGYLPSAQFWPGLIGGHCVMPNIEILQKYSPSPILNAIQRSNELKIQREIDRQPTMAPVSHGR